MAELPAGRYATYDLLGPYDQIAPAYRQLFGRWLPRSSHHDLELRILGRLNATDSSTLIDSPMASDLTTATMLLYDDSDGRITKFRQADLPDPDAVKNWLGG